VRSRVAWRCGYDEELVFEGIVGTFSCVWLRVAGHPDKLDMVRDRGDSIIRTAVSLSIVNSETATAIS
jgi:hypothetical protein